MRTTTHKPPPPPPEKKSIPASVMSLRDHFAAAALQGLLSDARTIAATSDEGELADVVAKMAYAFADAMIATRSAA